MGAVLNYESAAQHTITVRVTDSSGAVFDQNFVVSLRDLNEAPVASSVLPIAFEAGGIRNTLQGSDPSWNVLSSVQDQDLGDTLTVSGVAAESKRQ